MASVVLTVAQISNYIKRIFEHEPILRPVSVEGEISSLRFSNHMYVTLKDGMDSLECIMYSSKINDTARNLKIGDKVVFSGIIQAYTPQSKYSLVINSVENQGEGDIYKAFEELKAKLNKEGLFDSSHKKALPEFPHVIGVVTSATGAAYQDIRKTMENRSQFGDIILFPVPVQGQSAASEITRTITYIDENFYGKIDVLIVGRGGGSPEDLAAFNDEELARAIHKCRIPIISAVGHEIDISISDLVADFRAETPTAAANLVTKNKEDLEYMLKTYISDMNSVLGSNLIQGYYDIDTTINSMENSLKGLIDNYSNKIEIYKLVLEENDPRKFLDKGYALVTDSNGKHVEKASKVKTDEEYTITFQDGTAHVIGK